jgi:hypothetical protein
MTPIVSAVYNVPDDSESAWPVIHSTGRVCAEMVPTHCKESGDVGVERSLNVLLSSERGAE